MMRKKMVSIVALVTVLSTGLLVPDLLAFKGSLTGDKWWQLPAVKEKLQLTHDQIRKINTLWIEHRKHIIDIRSDIEKNYIDLENLMGQPMVLWQEAYKLAERLGELHSQRAKERIKMAIDIRQELTIEQFEKLRDIRRECSRRLREERFRRE
jgi:hypothetical protein